MMTKLSNRRTALHKPHTMPHFVSDPGSVVVNVRGQTRRVCGNGCSPLVDRALACHVRVALVLRRNRIDHGAVWYFIWCSSPWGAFDRA